MPLTQIGIDEYYAQITRRSDFAQIRQGLNRGSYIFINFLCLIVVLAPPCFQACSLGSLLCLGVYGGSISQRRLCLTRRRKGGC